MQDALINILLLSAPALILALVVGLVISILQATTQIQEQTLTFVPKIVAVLASVLIFGSWMLDTLVIYTADLLAGINSIIH